MIKFPQYKDYDMDIIIENMIWKKGKMFKELFKLGYDPADYTEKFQTSKIGEEWDTFNKYEYIDWYYGQSARAFAGDCARMGLRLKKIQKEALLPKLFITAEDLDPDTIERVGRIYEIWSRYTGSSSKEVYEKLDFYDVYEAAWSLEHTLDDEYNFVRGLAAHPEDFKIDPDRFE